MSITICGHLQNASNCCHFEVNWLRIVGLVPASLLVAYGLWLIDDEMIGRLAAQVEHSAMFYKLTSHRSRQMTWRGRNVLDECANSVVPAWWSVIICHRLLLIILATYLPRLTTQDRFFRSSPYFIQSCIPLMSSTDWLTYRRWLEPFTDWRTHFCICPALSFLFEASQSNLLDLIETRTSWGQLCQSSVPFKVSIVLVPSKTTETCLFLWLTCLTKLCTCN